MQPCQDIHVTLVFAGYLQDDTLTQAMANLNPQIEKLLVLQAREQKVRHLEQLLQTIPMDIKRLQAEIVGEEKTLAGFKARLRKMEVLRNDLDNRVGMAQEQILRYKNQQLQVKKNEEYQALIHEIEGLEKKILDWEEEEIGLMLEIDSETETYREQEAALASTTELIRGKIAVLENRGADLKNRLADASLRLQSADRGIDPAYLKAYRLLAARMKLPVVVGLEMQKCLGCHLRVSNETKEKARKGEALTTCHNCGRLVYFAS